MSGDTQLRRSLGHSDSECRAGRSYRDDRGRFRLPTGTELVQEIFPDASDTEADNLLWNRTAFPFAGDPGVYRAQLRRLKTTLDAGLHPCDDCSRPGTKRGEWSIRCDCCEAMWDEIRAQNAREDAEREAALARLLSGAPSREAE